MNQCDCGDCDICGAYFEDTFDEPSFDPHGGEKCRYCHVSDGCVCEPDEKHAKEQEREQKEIETHQFVDLLSEDWEIDHDDARELDRMGGDIDNDRAREILGESYEDYASDDDEFEFDDDEFDDWDFDAND